MITTPTRPFLATCWYVIIATTLCFAVASPAILGALPAEAAGVLVPAAQLTPFLTAIAFFLVRRRGRFVSVFALRWGRSWPAIGIGLAAVVAIAGLQLGVGLLSGAPMQPSGMIAAASTAVLILFVMQCVFAVGEELGWRGWLVTQLETRPFWQIAGVSSLVWVVWHLPALPLIVGDGGWEPGAAYLLAIASWAPFMVALRLWSGSVWPAVIVHGALNSIRVFLTQSIAVSDGINWTVEIAGALLWLAAAVMMHRRLRRRTSRTMTQPRAISRHPTHGGASSPS